MSRTRSVIALMLISATCAWGQAFDYDVLVGDFGAYKENAGKPDWYQYLHVDQSFAGVFAYSYSDTPLLLRFTPEEVRRTDGLLVITLFGNETAFHRLVLSGFRLRSGGGLATGILYMYKKEDGKDVLYNSIPLRLESLANNKLLESRLARVRKLVSQEHDR